MADACPEVHPTRGLPCSVDLAVKPAHTWHHADEKITDGTYAHTDVWTWGTAERQP